MLQRTRFLGTFALSVALAFSLAAAPAPAPAPTFRHTVALMYHATVDRNGAAFASAAVTYVNAKTEENLTPLIDHHLAAILASPIPANARNQYMEQPALIPINPNHQTGTTVYFVNGVATSQQDAQSEAAALSDALQRPIALLYNPSAIHGTSRIAYDAGVAADIAQCAYQRAWPFLADQSWVTVPSDSTTRQLTWLFDHTAGDITIISHSQGCLIVRNALLTAARFAAPTPIDPSSRSLADRLTWIATGVPLRDEEILPKPHTLQILAHADDPIAQWVGFRLDPSQFTAQNLASHDFSRYLPEIQVKLP